MTSNDLRAVAKVLDDITVKGRENMNKLLSCIQYLERIADELEVKPDDCTGE